MSKSTSFRAMTRTSVLTTTPSDNLSLYLCALIIVILLLQFAIGIVAGTIIPLLFMTFQLRLILELARWHIGLTPEEHSRFRDFLYPDDDADEVKALLVERVVISLRQRQAKTPHDKSYALYVEGTNVPQVDDGPFTLAAGSSYSPSGRRARLFGDERFTVLGQLPSKPTISDDDFLTSQVHGCDSRIPAYLQTEREQPRACH
ncbi:hypothetical protein B0I35DRAFT_482941 [Stachybotrys elegans]|uniref:Uncharacterized protein n=1 Tax=Stachybotrys elegans TaxID=80388 RepID=A0A8K0WLU5_9HYPO|nr:hypothetical protein B0I35DRAFT_482941 [Stachybotrys elegans]